MPVALRFKGHFSHFFSIIFFYLFFFIFSFAPLFAQQPENVFIAPITEVNGYGWSSAAYGGGLTMGAGTGGALGLNLIYATDSANFTFIEIQFFVRAYIYGENAYSGPFMQLGVGPAIYIDAISTAGEQSADYGNFSIGLTTGWRFLAGRYIFIEPALRLGYPYLAGVNLSIGVQLNNPKSAEQQRPLSGNSNEK